jgi:hypothetical protein
VTLLLTHHPTHQTTLSGMWEVPQSPSGRAQGRPTGLITSQERTMLWTIFVILGILWLLGFSLHVGGSLIHLLLVVALVVLVINLLSGRRSAI